VSGSFNLADYIDVAERIRVFNQKYPEGSLQSHVEFEGDGVLCTAYAYRTPDDPRPGMGHAFEPIPGKTPYTKDSEVMNAETSAWGRAIVALGFETKKIASADEVRSRSGAAPTGEKTESAPTAHEAGSTTAPDNPVARAQAAAEAAKAARTPQDDGAPENVVLTFGKYKGSHLGAAPKAYLTWLTENFEAKNAEQRRIVAAANLLLNDPDDGIPF